MALVGTVGYDNLVIRGAQHVGTITIAEENNLKRGAIVTALGAKMATGGVPYGILADDVDATDAATVGQVYLDGTYALETIEEVVGYSLAAADIAALRDIGIYVESIRA